MPKETLTIDGILAWADGFFARRNRYPRQDDGLISGTDLTWSAVNQSLKRGYRGLPGGTTLATLLMERRGVRHKKLVPRLSLAQILGWADAHHDRTGEWPGHGDGPISGSSGETWLAVETALRVGSRGLRGGSSLAQLLAARRGVRNTMDLPPLSHELILKWADRHRARTGTWPTAASGAITGQRGETWGAVDASLLLGHRGLSPGSSLARLLAAHRGVPHPHDVPGLTAEQILAWADAHRIRTGRWPTAKGPITDARGETWDAVNAALEAGLRGLPPGDSLPRFLARHRGKRNTAGLPPLTLDQIQEWMVSHYRRVGAWPTRGSGAIPDALAEETWGTVQNALERGKRGLPAGLSLVKIRDGLRETGRM